MHIATLHSWPRSTASAIALQRRLAVRLRQVPIATPQIVAGVDAAFSPDGREVIAGAVALELESGRVVAEALARRACRFPYVPGLLSFRELPSIIAALRALRCEPQVVLCDAHGLAHPRRFGLACHLGLWLKRPTIGCAKSRLCGHYEEPAAARGSESPLRLHGEVVGAVVRTRARVKPIFVSSGHLCELRSAVALALALATRFRLPEPTRRAHQLVTAARQAR